MILSNLRNRLLLASCIGCLLAVVVLPRFWIEWNWFEQFSLGVVLLRRISLQVLALSLVLGIGIPVQLQQLNRCLTLLSR